MKIFLIVIFLIVTALQKCEENPKQIDLACADLFQMIFNEIHFYQGKNVGITLSGIDTITILDKKQYLSTMNCTDIISISIDTNLLNSGVSHIDDKYTKLIRKVSNKKVKILQDDDLSPRILSFNPKDEEINSMKYKCYFLLEEINLKNDTLFIHLDKLITNHRVGLTYIKGKRKWILHNALIGKS